MKDMELTTFSELGLNADLLKALAAEGYTVPTPIQAQAIPSVIAGRDLMGIAQTGTGKTAAFALPILHRLAANRRPAPRHHARVLVLSPTRELAAQIADSFKTYGRHTGLTVAVMYGGVAHRPQATAMSRGVDVLVATPGRLIDHLDQRSVVLSGTEILVLDEADQMLDMGFIRPIRQIVAKLSQRRQSLFFSATMPKEIGALAAELLRDPVRVSVAPVATTVDSVRQSVIHIEPQKKASLLVELFADPAMKRALVFTRTKRGADKVARHLEAAGIIVSAIHGNKSQRQREEALEDFRAGRIRGLVATDIAARGIDVDVVTHVVNFELPNVPESYVHRIGRTARAGAEGHRHLAVRERGASLAARHRAADAADDPLHQPQRRRRPRRRRLRPRARRRPRSPEQRTSTCGAALRSAQRRGPWSWSWPRRSAAQRRLQGFAQRPALRQCR